MSTQWRDRREFVPPKERGGPSLPPFAEASSLAVYAELLATIGSTFGPLAADLSDREERRGLHLFQLLTHLRPLFEGLSQLREALLWLARRPGVDDDINTLLRDAAQQILSGVEAMLAEPDPRVLGEAGHLMEIEFLFRDFTRVPDRLDSWRQLSEEERAEQFGFGALRQREERALGFVGQHVLFDEEEYRFHALSLHARPLGRRGPLPAPDAVTGLFRDAGDLLHHASRVWEAGIRAAEATRSSRVKSGGDVDWPSLDAVDEARRMIDENNRAIGFPVT
jgi:hypothetical protein